MLARLFRACIRLVNKYYNMLMSSLCSYCNNTVYFEVGYTSDNNGNVMHEECIQQSGEDGGAISAMSDPGIIQAEIEFILHNRGLRGGSLEV